MGVVEGEAEMNEVQKRNVYNRQVRILKRALCIQPTDCELLEHLARLLISDMDIEGYTYLNYVTALRYHMVKESEIRDLVLDKVRGCVRSH